MKKYKSSDLTHKRAEVLKEAKANGVIIQECNTNGDVRCEYLITDRSKVGAVAIDGIGENLLVLNANIIKGWFMEVLLLVGFPMIIASYYAEKFKRIAIKQAQKECNKRFRHYYKYEL